MAVAGKKCCDKVARVLSWMVAAFSATFWVGLVAGLAALRSDLLGALPLVLLFLALMFIGIFHYCASRLMRAEARGHEVYKPFPVVRKRELLGATTVALLVLGVFVPQLASAVPRGRVEVSKELEFDLDTLMEVTVSGPAEVTEGDTAKVSVTLRAVRPLEVRYLDVYLNHFPVYKSDDKWEYFGWLPLVSTKVLEDTNVTGGWSTTIEREVKFSEWGDVVVEVWLGAWYTDRWGERKFGSVKVYFPLTKVEPELLSEAEHYRDLYESLSINYSALLWMYKRLNESHAGLERDYAELADKYSALYWNYTRLSEDYEALKRGAPVAVALLAVLLAVTMVAAYGLLKAIKAGRERQRATEAAASGPR